ncbi:hypothetical protein ACFE04_017039 [Oxalis oulophora]
MVRTPVRDQSGLKKGTWTQEEDRKLIAYVTKYGCWNWRQLPKFAGLSRCGKSCRLRWMNYLRPNVKRGDYTQEEEEIITRLHQSMGNRWSAIAAKLPGRTDNEIKNHWHTTLKKRLKEQNPAQVVKNDNAIRNSNGPVQPVVSDHQLSCSTTQQHSSTIHEALATTRTDDHMDPLIRMNINGDKDHLFEANYHHHQDVETSDLNFWTEPFVADNMGFNFLDDHESCYNYSSYVFDVDQMFFEFGF